MRLGKRTKINGGRTEVDHIFLDRFLPEANGDFIKIYLLLLRISEEEDRISIPYLADRLNVTESDVLRGLKYWERMEQLVLRFDERGDLQEIAFANTKATCEAAVTATKPTVADLSEDEEFVQLLYVVQKYLGKTLSGRDVEQLVHWYQELHFPADVIEYMVETCVNNGHRSMRYIEKVALDWHERGLMTVTRAKAYQQMYRADYYKILKAFGVNGRNPASSEVELMEKWLSEYGFAVEIVIEACNRTMSAINKPSFPYADKILRDWKEAGVRGVSDIHELDEQRKGANAYRVPARTQVPTSKNRFHNFDQRTYDYDALMRRLHEQG